MPGVDELDPDKAAALPTLASLLAAREHDDRTALIFGEQNWSWREVVQKARERHQYAVRLAGDRPLHLGLFMENTPEHVFWWLAATLHGAVAAGLNPTRRGPDLARDIAFTECSLVVTDTARRELLDGMEGLPRVVDVDETSYAQEVRVPLEGSVAAIANAVPREAVAFLLFTSGTTSAPKAVICSQGRMGRIAQQQQERRALTADDTFYVVMPLFHANALMAGIAPAIASGASVVLRRKFSASAWLDDVRRHGVTFFNYVGKPLNFILATPERPDDHDNPLRVAFGNEASEADIRRFQERFDCRVIDSFGSTEGEVQIMRTPETPSGSLGVARGRTVVVNPETLEECPRARFDERGRVTNGDEAVGEIVQLDGASLFEGYWRNPEATEKRLRHGWSWTGDLAYRDEEGYFYFAGRGGDWLRVDGENLATAPIERLLLRHEAFSGVAVVAVPDPVVGDQVLAVVECAPGHDFDATAFTEFLAAQPDLGTKWAPAFVKVVADLPRTPTNKMMKREVDAGIEPGTPHVWARQGSTYSPV
ncbi:acyl-CoA synthetase [Nocardioides sp. Soil797]|nr:acyl-CoA synthetase [Nocardioides sp. Soil797]